MGIGKVRVYSRYELERALASGAKFEEIKKIIDDSGEIRFTLVSPTAKDGSDSDRGEKTKKIGGSISPIKGTKRFKNYGEMEKYLEKKRRQLEKKGKKLTMDDIGRIKVGGRDVRKSTLAKRGVAAGKARKERKVSNVEEIKEIIGSTLATRGINAARNLNINLGGKILGDKKLEKLVNETIRERNKRARDLQKMLDESFNEIKVTKTDTEGKFTSYTTFAKRAPRPKVNKSTFQFDVFNPFTKKKFY